MLQFVSTCDHCQRNKASNEKPAGVLQQLLVPECRWQRVTVACTTDLPETKAGHTAVVVFVDQLSKLVYLAPCWNDMGAEEFAEIFLREMFRLHGIPKFLVSDRDKLLTSKFLLKSVKCLALVNVCPLHRTHRRTRRLTVLTQIWRICCSISSNLLRMTGM